jgi:hypothetical protein
MQVPAEPRRRVPTVTPWVALVLLFLVSLPAVTARFYASDEIEYFAYVRSLWFDGDLSFDNEYRYFYDRNIARAHFFKETFLDAETATGLRRNFAPMGSAVLWAPFYVATDAGVRVARFLGATVAADGFSRPYIAAVTYASALYGFVSLMLSAWAARLIVGARASAVAAVWLGTPLLFYMYVAPGFSHACSAFAVAAFVVIWLHVRRSWSTSGVVVLGAAAGIVGMVREQDIFMAIGPALDFVVTMIRSRRGPGEIVARAIAGVAAAVVCFLPQAITYFVLYGHVAPSPDVQQKMTWTSPNAWRVLISPDNGWFFWTPLALPALAGLIALTFGYPRRSGDADPPPDRTWIAAICLVMVASQIYVGGSLDTWAGAGSFGQRRLIGLTVFLVIGLTALFHIAGRGWRRYALTFVVLLSVWWNVGLTAQFGTGAMSRRRVEPARNAYTNFVTLPRELPRLAWRYAFDRQSFYQSRQAQPQ